MIEVNRQGEVWVFAEQTGDFRMQVLEGLAVDVSLDELVLHATGGRARADQRQGNRQVPPAADLQAAKELTHAGGFALEHAETVARTEHVRGLAVVRIEAE